MRLRVVHFTMFTSILQIFQHRKCTSFWIWTLYGVLAFHAHRVRFSPALGDKQRFTARVHNSRKTTLTWSSGRTLEIRSHRSHILSSGNAGALNPVIVTGAHCAPRTEAGQLLSSGPDSSRRESDRHTHALWRWQSPPRPRPPAARCPALFVSVSGRVTSF